MDNRSLKLDMLHRWEGRPLKLYVMAMDKDCLEFSDRNGNQEENRPGGFCLMM